MHMAILMPYIQATLLFGIGTLEELSFEAGKKMFNERFKESLSFAYLFWPPIFFGLYLLVPPRFGNLYMDAWNIVW